MNTSGISVSIRNSTVNLIGYQIVIGTISPDLSTVFGAGWATDPNVQWGSAGTFDATSQLFATKAAPTTGGFAVPWDRHSTSSQTITGSVIDTMTFGDFAGQEATPNNPDAVIHSTTGLSWTSYQNGPNSPGGSFQTWVPTIEAPITVPSGTGIVDTRLDLFRLDPDNTGTNPPGAYIGTVTIDTLGNVMFAVEATPTPTPTPTPTNSNADTDTDTDPDTNSDTDPDTNSDSDADTTHSDTNSDTNTDADTDTNADTNAKSRERVFAPDPCVSRHLRHQHAAERHLGSGRPQSGWQFPGSLCL